MCREIILPIFRSTRVCVTVCGIMQPRCCRPPAGNIVQHWGTAVTQWLRSCATNRNVVGSIPLGVIGIFQWHNPPDRTMDLGSIQPLTEMVPGEFPGGKCSRCVWLTTSPPPCAVVMKSGNIIFLEPCGPLQACKGTELPLSFYITYFLYLFFVCVHFVFPDIGMLYWLAKYLLLNFTLC